MTDNFDKAERLFASIGEIDDDFVEKAEDAAVASEKAGRKRLYKYGAIASGVVAVAYLLLRSRKSSEAA